MNIITLNTLNFNVKLIYHHYYTTIFQKRSITLNKIHNNSYYKKYHVDTSTSLGNISAL